MAFSTGFAPSGCGHTGTPRIVVSHGTKDEILPFENSSQRLVPQLKQAGYSVKFQEFDGPHGVPPEIARQAIEWFLK
jgi:phospholipase/carboxylesterase